MKGEGKDRIPRRSLTGRQLYNKTKKVEGFLKE
jgi:hypothetical protein